MKILILSLILAVLSGCATASNLKDLKPGMTKDEVRNELGNPSSAEFVNNKNIEVYHLRYFSKPVQGIFAVFYGLVFLPYQSYKVEYDDSGKLSSYYKR